MIKSFSKNLQTGFGLGLLLLVITSVISFTTIKKQQESSAWVNHTFLVIEKLEQLISRIKDAETGVRGYIAAGSVNFLQPYNHAYQDTQNLLRQIKELTEDNLRQQRSIPQLEALTKKKFFLLSSGVHSRRTGKAISKENAQSGKEVMDNIRTVILNMQNEENQLLKARQAALHTASLYAILIIIINGVLAIIIAYIFCSRLKITYFNNLSLRRELQQKELNIAKRIDIIEKVANQIAAGDYHVRIDNHEKDTLGNISFALNNMASSLEYSFQAIQELMKKKDEFIGIAAHELKTPLTSIKAYIQFIGKIKFDSDEGKKISPFIVKANNQINRLTEIVRNLLDVSLLTNQKLELKKTSFTLQEVITEVSADLRAATQTHELIIEGNPDLTLVADKFRIEQVLTNLFINAIKYSPGKSKVILKVLKDKGYIKVWVTDFGIGIPREKLPFVFDRYFRVHETSQNYAGMGLGLYISKGIIRRHGGQMGVESHEGEGSTFWFTLPAE